MHPNNPTPIERALSVLEGIEAKVKAATAPPWTATTSGGRDCVWLDIVVGPDDDDEILHAETMPQPSVVRESDRARMEAVIAQHAANLEAVAAIRNAFDQMTALIRAQAAYIASLEQVYESLGSVDWLVESPRVEPKREALQSALLQFAESGE